MFIRNAWYVAAWADEVGASPVARRILDEPVVLFRTATGEIAALADRCSHRGTPLAFGRVVERLIDQENASVAAQAKTPARTAR